MSKNKSRPSKPTIGEIIGDSSDSSRNRVKGVKTVTMQRTWSGPLPPPEIFNQYPKEVQEAIIAQADAQMKHRHKIESKVVASGVANSGRGMNYAFWLTLTMIGAGILLVGMGHSTAGLVAIFGTGSFQAGNYLLQKAKEMHRTGKRAKKLNKEHIEDEQASAN